VAPSVVDVHRGSSSIILSTQCHDPCHDSYHKIRHVFILEEYHPIISSDIHDENLEHNEMSVTRHAIVGIENRGCIGYCLVSIITTAGRLVRPRSFCLSLLDCLGFSARPSTGPPRVQLLP